MSTVESKISSRQRRVATSYEVVRALRVLSKWYQVFTELSYILVLLNIQMEICADF